jgi:hypothetical protein
MSMVDEIHPTKSAMHIGYAILDQKVGDLVLFPSWLVYRTLPFHSDQERVCIAFNIKPG